MHSDAGRLKRAVHPGDAFSFSGRMPAGEMKRHDRSSQSLSFCSDVRKKFRPAARSRDRLRRNWAARADSIGFPIRVCSSRESKERNRNRDGVIARGRARPSTGIVLDKANRRESSSLGRGSREPWKWPRFLATTRQREPSELVNRIACRTSVTGVRNNVDVRIDTS